MSAVVDEDPFGPGDPLVVARMVRRSLAAAGRRAVDVMVLVVVTDRPPGPEALARFVRRALGPHGASVSSSAVIVAPDLDHQGRLDVARPTPAAGGWVVVVALGPGPVATTCCLDD